MNNVLAAGFIFCFVYFIHSTSPVITSTDSMWSIYTAKSLLDEGDLDLDEYRSTINAKHKFGVRIKKGHFYNFFPPGPSLMAVPFVWVFEKAPAFWLTYIPGFERQEKNFKDTGNLPSAEDAHLALERIVASFCVALSASLVFLAIALKFPFTWALFLAMGFAFSTSTWSVESRGLWQHGPSTLFLSGALLLAVMSERYPSLLAWTALPLGASYITRPTNVLSLVGFLFFILYYQPKRLHWFIIIGTLTLLPLFLWSLETYNRILPPYYRSGRLALHESWFEALLAQLVSPSRGLFVFSPFLLFSVYTTVHNIITKNVSPFECLLWIICFLHWVIVSSFPIWWGGHTFGPRLMSDVLPYLVFLVSPFYTIVTRKSKFSRIVLLYLFSFSVITGIFIHWNGAYSYAPQRWNVSPVNVDSNPERVWSVEDIQFLR